MVEHILQQEERNRQPRVSEQAAMKASDLSNASKRRFQGSQKVCTHPTCKSKKGHTLENCWMRARELARQADDIEARRKGKEKANAAKASGEGEEAAALAGNASTSILDPSHPCSPLILDASTDCVKLAIEGVSANFALKHTVRPAGLCECKGLYYKRFRAYL